MTENTKLFESFKDWVETDVRGVFSNYEFGVSNPEMENTAWLKLDTKGTISGIKIWSTGDYYCEILTFDKEEPDMALSDKLPQDLNFSAAFSRFLNRVVEIDQAAS
ncbi:immunity protein TriTu family protein [Gymnodinialimonas sp.]